MNPYFFAVGKCEIGECAIGDSPLLHLKKNNCRTNYHVTKRDSPQLHIEKACELTNSNGSQSRYLAGGQQAE